MQFKQAWFELGIPRLEDRGASPLSINFGKKISSKFTKSQSLNKFWKTHNYARYYKGVHVWMDQL